LPGAKFHRLEDNSWHIFNHYIEEYSDLLSENQKEIVWANIKYCDKCFTCEGKRRNVLGKEFDNVCSCCRFVLANPAGEALDCAKKMVEIRINDIIQNF